jgi:hypothetical protein
MDMNLIIRGSSFDERVESHYRRWKQNMSYFSVFAAVSMLVGSPAESPAAPRDPDADPPPARRLSEPAARPAAKACGMPNLMRRKTGYLLPHQVRRYDLVSEFAGRDDCPGTVIPEGTYTATAPFVDTGDTTGANSTVNYAGYIGYCYYGFNAPGPDHVYTFTLSARTTEARIEVASGSSTYAPLIYVLDGRNSGSCPSGSGNSPCSQHIGASSTSGGAAILDRDVMFALPLNVPLHLFIDGPTASASGAYTIRMQGVTLKAGPRAKFDFNADYRADLSVYRPSEGRWYVDRDGVSFFATQFGLTTDRVVPADYDGDGRTDIAVFRDGTWYWLNSSNGAFNAFPFGLAGDQPQPADFNGDGRAELAVFRNGTWYTFNLATGQSGGLQFGAPGDIPLVGDYDGDGRADHAVFRNGTWYMQKSLFGFVSLPFGLPGDRPVPADYDGDSIVDQAIFRNGIWFIRHSLFEFVETVRFGLPTDVLVPADYDGDSSAEVAVYRDGVWYIVPEFNDGRNFSTRRFGLASDRPLPAAYLP